jgi:hypothetical protein
MVSFLLAFPPKSSMHYSSLTITTETKGGETRIIITNTYIQRFANKKLKQSIKGNIRMKNNKS